MERKKIKGMSLFANVGVAEAYLDKTCVDIVLANEIEENRAKFYQHLYPNVDVIIGDIRDSRIKSQLIDEGKRNKVELIIATPPCQGMSTAGKKQEYDKRNSLICDAVDIIKELLPDFVLLENVPEQLNTKIMVGGKETKIPDYLNTELEKFYYIENDIINAADYEVPQNRERAFFLLTKKSLEQKWKFPPKCNTKKTMRDAIGDLPILDPLIKDISYEEHKKIFPDYEENKKKALQISKWHVPPTHVYRQIYAMLHTPTGKSAFSNIDKFKPRKTDGNIVKGYNNTYKRQNWDTPAYTVTMYNRTIGSQNNVHPGRFIGKDIEGYEIYSDPRVLTVFELMRIMSLPDNWDIPDGFSESFIRSVIGEGIPPLLMKKIMEMLPYED